MPTAPQQFAAGGGPFYVAPPDGQVNLFAAFASNFQAARNPWAMQVFMARLKASDPTAKYELLGELEKERARLLAEHESTMRATERAAADRQLSADSTFNHYVDYLAGEEANRTRASVAGAEQSTEAMKAGVLQGKELEFAQRTRRDVMALGHDLERAISSGDERAADRAATALENRMALASQELLDFEPGKRRTIAGEMQEALGELGASDPTARKAIVDRVAPIFAQGGTVELQRPGAPRARSLGDIVGELEGAGVYSRGQPTTTSTSTTTRTTTPSAPGVPAGDAGPPPAAPARQPAPGGSTDSPSLAGVRHIDAMIEAIRSEDPLEYLGGFFDPLPGARGNTSARAREPGTTTTVERLAAAPRTGEEPEKAEPEAEYRIGKGGGFEYVKELEYRPPEKKPASTRPAPKPGDKASQLVEELLNPAEPAEREAAGVMAGLASAPKGPPASGTAPVKPPTKAEQQAEELEARPRQARTSTDRPDLVSPEKMRQIAENLGGPAVQRAVQEGLQRSASEAQALVGEAQRVSSPFLQPPYERVGKPIVEKGSEVAGKVGEGFARAGENLARALPKGTESEPELEPTPDELDEIIEEWRRKRRAETVGAP